MKKLDELLLDVDLYGRDEDPVKALSMCMLFFKASHECLRDEINYKELMYKFITDSCIILLTDDQSAMLDYNKFVTQSLKIYDDTEDAITLDGHTINFHEYDQLKIVYNGVRAHLEGKKLKVIHMFNVKHNMFAFDFQERMGAIMTLGMMPEIIELASCQDLWINGFPFEDVSYWNDLCLIGPDEALLPYINKAKPAEEEDEDKECSEEEDD